MKESFRTVVLVGPDTPVKWIQHKNQNVHGILGDGKGLIKQEYVKNLSEFMDENTHIYISAHGGTDEEPSSYQLNAMMKVHKTDLIKGLPATNEALEKIAQSFPLSFKKSQPRVIQAWMCEGSIDPKRDLQSYALSDCSVIIHSGSDSILMALSDEDINSQREFYDFILEKNKRPPFDVEVFRKAMLLPETAVFYRNGKSFTYRAPKEPMGKKDTKRYIEEEIKRFDAFCIEELKYDKSYVNDSYHPVIDNKALVYYNDCTLCVALCRSDGKEKSLDWIRKCLDKKANPNLKLINGDTALDLAFSFKDMHAVSLLIAYGATLPIQGKGNSSKDFTIQWINESMALYKAVEQLVSKEVFSPHQFQEVENAIKVLGLKKLLFKNAGTSQSILDLLKTRKDFIKEFPAYNNLVTQVEEGTRQFNNVMPLPIYMPSDKQNIPDKKPGRIALNKPRLEKQTGFYEHRQNHQDEVISSNVIEERTPRQVTVLRIGNVVDKFLDTSLVNGLDIDRKLTRKMIMTQLSDVIEVEKFAIELESAVLYKKELLQCLEKNFSSKDIGKEKIEEAFKQAVKECMSSARNK